MSKKLKRMAKILFFTTGLDFAIHIIKDVHQKAVNTQNTIGD